MLLDAIVAELDAYFRVPDVRDDDWGPVFGDVYDEPYWRDHVAPAYEGRWNGLMVRGGDEVDRAVTCVFPSDRIVEELPPRTLLFSEHPLDFADRPGFLPLARESFERLRDGGSSFYHVHAPLDMHEEVAPSLLVAQGVGLSGIETYYPIADGIPGGACAIGDTSLSTEGLAEFFGIRVTGFLGWFATRTYHLYQLPLITRKVRVVTDWTVSLWFRRDIAELGSLGHPRRIP